MTSRAAAYLRYEPAAVAAAVQLALSVAVGLGWQPRPGVTGAMEAAVSALCGLIVAVKVMPRDRLPAALSGFVTAGGTLLMALGVHGITAASVSGFNAIVAAVIAFALRSSVTPKAAAPQ